MWIKENTPPLLVEVQTFKDTMEINMAVPQKVGNQSTSRSSYTTLGHISKGHSILPQGHMLNHVHCGFIHNSQKL